MGEVRLTLGGGAALVGLGLGLGLGLSLGLSPVAAADNASGASSPGVSSATAGGPGSAGVNSRRGTPRVRTSTAPGAGAPRAVEMRTRLAAPEGGPSQPSADRRAGKNVNPTIRLPLIRSAAAQTTPVPEVAVDTAAVSASVLTDAPAPTPVVTSAVGTDRAVPLATAAIAPAVQSVPARRPAIAVLDNVLAGLGANPATNLVITLPTMAALTGSRQTATAAAVVEATAVAAAPPAARYPRSRIRAIR